MKPFSGSAILQRPSSFEAMRLLSTAIFLCLVVAGFASAHCTFEKLKLGWASVPWSLSIYSEENCAGSHKHFSGSVDVITDSKCTPIPAAMNDKVESFVFSTPKDDLYFRKQSNKNAKIMFYKNVDCKDEIGHWIRSWSKNTSKNGKKMSSFKVVLESVNYNSPWWHLW
ncbi:hypothetical protein BV22DRAFT_659682 [Leucogyrophana mollusca]|uniref:Uncharacterized protein n=1 Tax=Leucogyrophana mollusca TaxID=85980 RepID=A0ACB8BC17_9AGAM|nr:hypothetical protein BV22DRAFT_659682 [Leucogyrophana mollusca]